TSYPSAVPRRLRSRSTRSRRNLLFARLAGEDGRPVGLHADHGPSVRFRPLERVLGAGGRRELTVCVRRGACVDALAGFSGGAMVSSPFPFALSTEIGRASCRKEGLPRGSSNDSQTEV